MTLWSWFRDWREQHSALKELKNLGRKDESTLEANALNPLHLAKLALDTGDNATAAARWQDARSKMPNVIYRSEDSLPILLGLQRYDEAEAFMREGHRRFRHDRRWLPGLAEISERKGDFAEAALRWKAAQAGAVVSTIPWIREGICLRNLGRTDEAEAVYATVLRSFRAMRGL